MRLYGPRALTPCANYPVKQRDSTFDVRDTFLPGDIAFILVSPCYANLQYAHLQYRGNWSIHHASVRAKARMLKSGSQLECSTPVAGQCTSKLAFLSTTLTFVGTLPTVLQYTVYMLTTMHETKTTDHSHDNTYNVTPFAQIFPSCHELRGIVHCGKTPPICLWETHILPKSRTEKFVVRANCTSYREYLH